MSDITVNLSITARSDSECPDPQQLADLLSSVTEFSGAQINVTIQKVDVQTARVLP